MGLDIGTSAENLLMWGIWVSMWLLKVVGEPIKGVLSVIYLNLRRTCSSSSLWTEDSRAGERGGGRQGARSSP
jgi:hypothetical protein